MDSIAYYVRLNEQDVPIVLYRATPQMQEQVWNPVDGWIDTEFLLDVLMCHGDTYFIETEMARQLFPPEAFIDDGGDGDGPPGDGQPVRAVQRQSDNHASPTPAIPMLHPDALHWLSEQTETASSIDALVEDGWMGCSLEDLIPWLSDREVFERIAAISWQKTAREADGEVALMTADSGGLDGLLEWMLEHRGQCPMVYAPEEEPEVPDAMPLLRPLATNLPEGLTSEQLVDADMIEDLADIFAAIKEAFGNQAHLMQFDYGTFAEVQREHAAVLLKGEFIDLTDGEIFWFTIDGRQNKLAYQSTGRTDPAFRREVIEQQEQVGSMRLPEATESPASSASAAPTPSTDLVADASVSQFVPGFWMEAASGESRRIEPVQYSNDPEVQACLASSAVTDLSLQALLAEGFYGFSLRELLPRLEADSLLLIYLGDGWVITNPAQPGEAALLTDCLDDFDLLLECLTEEEGDIPTIYAPDDTTLPVDSLPLQRATAYNLPEGTRSHEVVDDKLQELLEEIFQDLQTAYGERAHLYRFDYGTFVEHAENDVIVLSGEFVDLEDGAIYSFTMDGVQQRIRYAETGRIHASMAVGGGTAGCGGTAVGGGTAASHGTAAAADSPAGTTASIP